MNERLASVGGIYSTSQKANQLIKNIYNNECLGYFSYIDISLDISTR